MHQNSLLLFRESELLAEIARIAASGSGPEDLSERFLTIILSHVPFERGVVRMVDGDGNLQGGVAVGSGAEIELPTERSQTATEAIGLGRVVHGFDPDPEDPAEPSRFAALGLRSSVTMPLLTDEAVVGLFTLRRETPRGFTKPEVEFIRRAAFQIGPSLDNSRLLDAVSSVAAIVESSPDLISRASLDGPLQYLNPAGRLLLGISATLDVSTMSLSDLMDEASSALIRGRALQTALSAGSWSGELTAMDTNGRALPVEAVVSVNYHRNGSLLGLSVTMRDITLRK